MIDVNIFELRSRLQLSQPEFAEKFGFNLGTLRHWEQGSRTPDKAARTLLDLVVRFPDIVEAVVREKT